MTTEYKETIVDPGENTEGDVLDALAGGHPHIFIIAKIVPPTGEIDLTVSVGGGIGSADTLRAVLEKTLRALP
jgi:phosphoribosylformimino-5-aminoimidazole carboxamide ribonucleotide (ProFAR) isomerase